MILWDSIPIYVYTDSQLLERTVMSASGRPLIAVPPTMSVDNIDMPALPEIDQYTRLKCKHARVADSAAQ